MLVLISLVVAAMLHGSSAQTTHVVGDQLGWLVPPAGDIAYRTWAAEKTFTVGDVLVFNFTQGRHDVAEVSKEAYDSCNASNTISLSTTSPTNITLTSAGEHHFLCTFQDHCRFGQRLAINVSASPQPATPPPPPAPGPSRVGMTYTVGDGLGWLVPPGGPIAYETWARGKSFLVGDTLVFNFTSGQHSVLQVTRAEFDSCNVTTTTTPPTTDTPARITLTSAGEHYYICTFPQHCTFGQKLAINVTGGSSAPAPAPSTPTPTPTPSPSATPPSSSTAPPPSSTTPPPSSATPPTSSGGPSPSTPSTPSPVTPPPPPPPSAAAPSVAVAALPFTFLAVALAFLV